MSSAAPIGIAVLLGVVAWGVGGYDPWAGLVLELGSLALAGIGFAILLLRTRPEDRERFLAIRRSQKRGSTEIEILEPSRGGPSRGPFPDPFFWMGFPFRRTGAGLLVLLMTGWIALSLVPIPPPLLSILSPRAFALRSEAAALLGRELTRAPWSVAPFLALQDLLLWLAYLSLFLVTYHLARSSRAVKRLSLSLLLLGVASGIYGLAQWLVASSGTEGAVAGGLQATGSFGNRNHYAFFQEMLLLVGLGFLLLRWHEGARRSGHRVSAQEEKAKALLLGLGVAAIGLGLLFSLSRSGITFALAGGALFLYLTRQRRSATLALATALVAIGLWIGLGPVVSRFQIVTDELAEETGRIAVWRDSLGAVSDYWLTGSGLSSFQHVYPAYRSFGGRRFYSWAHNDYLQLGVELGLPGLALALALMLWAIRRARLVRRELLEAGSSLPLLHAGYCSAAIAVALHSFTDFGLHLPANAALLAVILAVVTGMAPSRRSKGSPGRKSKTLRRAPPST